MDVCFFRISNHAVLLGRPVDHLLNSGISSVREATMMRYSKFIRGLMRIPSMEVAVICDVWGGQDGQWTSGQGYQDLLTVCASTDPALYPH